MLAALAIGVLSAACGGGARAAEPASSAAAVERDAATAQAAARQAAVLDGLDTAQLVAPSLQVFSHQSGARVSEEQVQFRGIATAGSVVIADATVAEIGPYGHWAVTLSLEPGANLKTFTVTDAAGVTSRESMLVHYAPMPAALTLASASTASAGTAAHTSTGTDEAKTARAAQHDKKLGSKDGAAAHEQAAFSAHQKYGSCGEDPPYDVFSGTAAAGAAITISSLYGSASTVADEHGSWWVTVYFPAAPEGQTFEVTAGDGASARTFSFVHKQ